MTQSANAQRGESSLVIDARKYVLRPTFSTLVAAEEELGSLFAVVDRAAEGKITLAEIAALLWHCLPSDNRPGRDQVGDAVMAMGLLDATKPVRAILAEVLKGKA